MKVLVTGGGGFIGSHLVDYHLALNDFVFVIDNLSTGKFKNISEHIGNPNFSFYKADLSKCPDLEFILAQCDIVYDLAAVVGMFNIIEKPISTLHVNVDGTEKLLSTIAKFERKPLLVIASSSEVYGAKSTAMNENDALLIPSANKAHASYPVSKICNEIMGMAYFKEKKLPVIIARIFNTVGTRQSSRYGMVLPRFIRQSLRNEPLTIFSDGLQTRCFCDVRDLCKILHLLTQTEKSWGQIINVGNDKVISILDLAKLVIDLSQSNSGLKFQAYDDVYGKEYIEIPHRKPDLTKLKTLIDYSPKWTLENTIQDNINYLNEQK